MPTAEPEILPIHACGLTKRYGSTVALDGLDLHVHAGEVYGFGARRDLVVGD
jgi:ABC-type multidrug transport system ATPase subunit